MEKHVYIAQTNTNWLKNIPLKLTWVKSEKMACKKLPKMLIGYISPGRNIRMIGYWWIKDKLKTIEQGNFFCFWALWKVNGKENGLNIMNMMGRNVVTDSRGCDSGRAVCSGDFGNQEIVIHYCTWCVYFATWDWSPTALFSLVHKMRQI